MFAKKSLGQYFLRCNWVLSTLIKSAELNSSDTVLEIGPGTGILTKELAKNVRQVMSVEKDEKLAENLAEDLKKDDIQNVKIIKGDILKSYAPEVRKIGRYKVVANIPYYLTSRLLRLLLENSPRPKLIVLTVQKEVAQRICAKPPDMNLLALSIQTFGRPEIVKIVPAECFSPKPKVDSAIIKISGISDNFFRENRISQEEFFKLARQAFSQKRKMLTTSLRPYFVQHSVLNMGKARPQELGLEQWAKLVGELSPPLKFPKY